MSKRHRGFIENYQPRASTVALLEPVQAVLDLYAAYLPLTIRQIFYRLVGAGEGYEKTEKAYERLLEAIGKARREPGLSLSPPLAMTVQCVTTRLTTAGSTASCGPSISLSRATASIARSVSQFTPSWPARPAAWCRNWPARPARSASR
jgi:hypothetical protein